MPVHGRSDYDPEPFVLRVFGCVLVFAHIHYPSDQKRFSTSARCEWTSRVSQLQLDELDAFIMMLMCVRQLVHHHGRLALNNLYNQNVFNTNEGSSVLLNDTLDRTAFNQVVAADTLYSSEDE